MSNAGAGLPRRVVGLDAYGPLVSLGGRIYRPFGVNYPLVPMVEVGGRVVIEGDTECAEGRSVLVQRMVSSPYCRVLLDHNRFELWPEHGLHMGGEPTERCWSGRPGVAP